MNVIDWSLPATRIGDRKRPLKEKTMKRIQLGIDKFSGKPLVISMDRSYGHDNRTRSIQSPMPTQTAGNTMGFVSTPMILDTVFSFSGRTTVPKLATSPMPTQTSRQSFALMTAKDNGSPPFMVELYGTSTVRPLIDPIGTITASGSHHALAVPEPFIITYYRNGKQSGMREPIPTVVTRQRHGLVTHGRESDINDCSFRMLGVHEIGASMSFPRDYIVLGTKREQVKQYGQAVTPPVMEWLVDKCIASLS